MLGFCCSWVWGRGKGNCANGINSSLQKEKKVKSLSRVQLFATLRTVAYQAPLSIRGIFQTRVLEWVAS